jgi:hypothetical protein
MKCIGKENVYESITSHPNVNRFVPIFEKSPQPPSPLIKPVHRIHILEEYVFANDGSERQQREGKKKGGSGSFPHLTMPG